MKTNQQLLKILISLNFKTIIVKFSGLFKLKTYLFQVFSIDSSLRKKKFQNIDSNKKKNKDFSIF